MEKCRQCSVKEWAALVRPAIDEDVLQQLGETDRL
jgi:hypothetical protein